MSSSMDAGYALDEAIRIKHTPCKKSPIKKHKWIKQNTGGTSDWYECKYCKGLYYTK